MELIEFKNISKKFGSFMALEKVSVNVRRHTIHAIIGENGAGKSTLVKILVGIEQPTTGQIYLRTELY